MAEPTPAALRGLRDIRDGHISIRTISPADRTSYNADRLPPAGLSGRWWEPLIDAGWLRSDRSTGRLAVTDEGRRHLRNAGMEG